MTQEHLYAMALTKIPNLGITNAKILYKVMGSATAVFENRNDIRSYIPDASERLTGALQNVDMALKLAEAEMGFVNRKNVRILAMNDESYPQRMKACDDAPVVLYYCGNADLNKVKVVSMVGARKCTEYGKDLCNMFVSELKRHYPDVLIVSGLAYGIDISSHRAALANDMDTVGVLAHGLDRIYPSLHRDTAVKMVSHGGLLTEYMSGTTPEKGNFVSRNRIVAGLCDACVVVESALKSGSLITADISHSYNRDVFAFPGRINDEFSAGCNKLILNNRACLLQNVEQFLQVMNWANPLDKPKPPVQRELFVELTPEEELIVKCLNNADEKSINLIVNETGLSYNIVSSVMFELELKGVIKVLGGARYRLIK